MKNKLLVLFGLIVIIISIVLVYSQTKQTKISFDINSLNLSSWSKNDNDLPFWFPKDDITVVKNIKNSYSLNYSKFEIPSLTQQIINSIISYEPISKISQELEEQNFTELTESTGLFANDENSGTPYYLITYQKNNTICQISLIFECGETCALDNPQFGCANFDFKKDYQDQKQYYQLISTDDTKELYSNHKIAITSVLKNSSGYLSINSGSWYDGGVTYFDKQNNKVCDGKPCCDESSKNNPDLYGNWCTEDYQTLETYQPVGF